MTSSLMLEVRRTDSLLYYLGIVAHPPLFVNRNFCIKHSALSILHQKGFPQEAFLLQFFYVNDAFDILNIV